MDDDIGNVIRQAITARASAARRIELSDSVVLGEGGLEMDSIQLVEIIEECERRTGLPAPEQIFTRRKVTVGGLVRAFRAAASAT